MQTQAHVFVAKRFKLDTWRNKNGRKVGSMMTPELDPVLVKVGMLPRQGPAGIRTTSQPESGRQSNRFRAESNPKPVHFRVRDRFGNAYITIPISGRELFYFWTSI